MTSAPCSGDDPSGPRPPRCRSATVCRWRAQLVVATPRQFGCRARRHVEPVQPGPSMVDTQQVITDLTLLTMHTRAIITAHA